MNFLYCQTCGGETYHGKDKRTHTLWCLDCRSTNYALQEESNDELKRVKDLSDKLKEEGER